MIKIHSRMAHEDAAPERLPENVLMAHLSNDMPFGVAKLIARHIDALEAELFDAEAKADRLQTELDSYRRKFE